MHTPGHPLHHATTNRVNVSVETTPIQGNGISYDIMGQWLHSIQMDVVDAAATTTCQNKANTARAQHGTTLEAAAPPSSAVFHHAVHNNEMIDNVGGGCHHDPMADTTTSNFIMDNDDCTNLKMDALHTSKQHDDSRALLRALPCCMIIATATTANLGTANHASDSSTVGNHHGSASFAKEQDCTTISTSSLMSYQLRPVAIYDRTSYFSGASVNVDYLVLLQEWKNPLMVQRHVSHDRSCSSCCTTPSTSHHGSSTITVDMHNDHHRGVNSDNTDRHQKEQQYHDMDTCGNKDAVNPATIAAHNARHKDTLLPLCVQMLPYCVFPYRLPYPMDDTLWYLPLCFAGVKRKPNPQPSCQNRPFSHDVSLSYTSLSIRDLIRILDAWHSKEQIHAAIMSSQMATTIAAVAPCEHGHTSHTATPHRAGQLGTDQHDLTRDGGIHANTAKITLSTVNRSKTVVSCIDESFAVPMVHNRCATPHGIDTISEDDDHDSISSSTRWEEDGEEEETDSHVDMSESTLEDDESSCTDDKSKKIHGRKSSRGKKCIVAHYQYDDHEEEDEVVLGACGDDDLRVGEEEENVIEPTTDDALDDEEEDIYEEEEQEESHAALCDDDDDMTDS